jgi:hypothetical protein
MCMFSRHVEHVAATKIFAGVAPDGRQTLIYSMTVTVGEPLAMVLPLPVPANGPDDAVELVNLEGYAELFVDLKKAFPDTGIYPQALGRSRNAPPPKLVVHQVGAFVASYVPHARDFARLDPRFRLPPGVLDALPHYTDWGFAVFQLDKTKQKPIHPMAMRFPRRDPASIFFPLTHVHDGVAPAQAPFDHTLYAQLPGMIAALAAWTPSHAALGTHVHARAAGLIDLQQGGQVKTLFGAAPNQDLWMRAPAGLSDGDLLGGGPSYRYRVNATYYFSPVSHPTYPAWRDTTVNKLPALCRGIRDGLAALTTRNARAWQLGAIADDAAPYFMNGDQLWSGVDYMTGRHDPEPQRAGRIAFRPFSTSVEQQDITLAFAQLPSQDDARAINRALCDMLEQIARA